MQKVSPRISILRDLSKPNKLFHYVQNRTLFLEQTPTIFASYIFNPARMNATGELAATITEHINYITDTLARCQQHKNHLSNLYDSIMIKQRREFETLENREKTLQKTITKQEDKIAFLENHIKISRASDHEKWNQV